MLTIRMPLREVVLDYPIVRSGDTRVRSVWGFKHQGLSYIDGHSERLYEACEEAYETMDDEDAEDFIVHTLTQIPSIGPAKAGFITQMVYGLSGCIDGHNLTRFGLPEETFKFRKDVWKHERQRALLHDYNAFCRREGGGTRRLWDDWCCYVADRDPVNYHDPEFVSALHLVPLQA